MKREYEGLAVKMIKLLEDDPWQPIKNLVKKLGVNGTFLPGYLEALENQGYVKSERIGLIKVKFEGDVERR